MGIKIGDKNKITNSVIGNNNSSLPTKENFTTRHPLIFGFILSMATGFILLFSFWEKAVAWIEELFK